jgi:hypothetical protein
MRRIPRGTVLIDNTTLFGAAAAYDLWPPNAQDWREPNKSVALRSLMDIIECVIVHDNIATDSSSRAFWVAPELSSERGAPSNIPHDYDGLSRFVGMINDRIGKHPKTNRTLISEIEFAEDLYGLSLSSALSSLTMVSKYISDGTFEGLAQHFHKIASEFSIPKFYRDGTEFGSLLLGTLPVLDREPLDAAIKDIKSLGAQANLNQTVDNLPTLIENYDTYDDDDYDFETIVSRTEIADIDLHAKIYERVDEVKSMLNILRPEIHNAANIYAMFSFRGLYYQVLAQLSGCSYRPHPWRSEIIDKFITDRPADFAEMVNVLLAARARNLPKI